MATKIFIKKPINIGTASIKTQPTKTSYYAGDKFNPTGMEILIHYQSEVEVTLSNFEFDSANSPALSVADTYVNVTVVYDNSGTREVYSVKQPITVADKPVCSDCTATCASSCTTGCTGSCTTGCTGSCDGYAPCACEDGCTSSCGSACGNSCGSGCSSSCGDTCGSDCSGNCSAYCGSYWPN